FDMRFIFFHFFHCTLLLCYVFHFRNTLYLFSLQISIRHWVTIGYYFQSLFPLCFHYFSRSLAFTCSCSDGTDGNDRLCAFHHRMLGSSSREVCSRSVYDCAYAHDFFIM